MIKPLMRWFQPPIFTHDEDKTRSALLLNVVLTTFIIAFPVLFVGAILGGRVPALERVLIIIACAWLMFVGMKLIMHTGRVAVAGMVTVIVVFFSATLAIYNLGTIRAPATSLYLLAIVIAGLTISRRAIIWMVSICAITIITLLLAEKNGFLPPPSLAITVTQGITFTVIFTIVGILLYLAVKSIDEALSLAREELAERRLAEASLQRFSDRLEIVHEIDRSLLSARSSHEIAVGALARIRQLIPSRRASVTLFDFEKGEALFLAADFDGMESIPDTPIPLNEYGPYAINAIRQNKPWITDDILTEPQITQLDRRLADEYGIRAWLALPLLSKGSLIGGLNLGRSIGIPFSMEDARIAHDIANQLAITLEQTNLHNALQNELKHRQKLINELEASNGELERFTYTVSHDLRNPLVTIKGFLGMLEKDIRENRAEKVQADLERIAGAADRMNELLSDLLELSRIGRILNPAEEIDMVQLARDAVELLDARLRSRNISVHISPDLPAAYGDRIRLREVFENLIDNAAKYMGEQPNPAIEIGVRHDSEPILYIRDNGIGIEPKYHSKIFTLFEQLDPGKEGTGIGLALVKRIIETHGGKIWVESEGAGTGSTFCFTLPTSKEPEN